MREWKEFTALKARVYQKYNISQIESVPSFELDAISIEQDISPNSI